MGKALLGLLLVLGNGGGENMGKALLGLFLVLGNGGGENMGKMLLCLFLALGQGLYGVGAPILPSEYPPLLEEKMRQEKVRKDYLEILGELAETYGTTTRSEKYYVTPDFETDWWGTRPEDETGLFDADIWDVDGDGMEELFCLYWASWSDIYIRLYTGTDTGAKLLLEEKLLRTTDNWEGFYLGSDSFDLMLMRDNIGGWYGGEPDTAFYFYSVSEGELKTQVCSAVYSDRFGPGDPQPEWITTTYTIDGQEVTEEAWHACMESYGQDDITPCGIGGWEDFFLGDTVRELAGGISIMDEKTLSDTMKLLRSLREEQQGIGGE